MKSLAASRGTSMQAILERALNLYLPLFLAGDDPSSTEIVGLRVRGTAEIQIPSELSPVIEYLTELWSAGQSPERELLKRQFVVAASDYLAAKRSLGGKKRENPPSQPSAVQDSS